MPSFFGLPSREAAHRPPAGTRSSASFPYVPMRHITLIATGGTIEKTYDEQTGELVNRRSVVGRMLGRLRLEATRVSTVELLHKDSLYLTDDDRARILEAVR